MCVLCGSAINSSEHTSFEDYLEAVGLVSQSASLLEVAATATSLGIEIERATSARTRSATVDDVMSAPGSEQPVQANAVDTGPLYAVVSNYTAINTSNSWSGFGVVAAPKIVTYSFETSASAYLTTQGGFSTAFVNSFQPFTESDKTTTRGALQQWDDATGIVFIEVAAGLGDIKFSHQDFSLDSRTAGFGGFGYYPTVSYSGTSSFASDLGGDVFITNGRSPSTYLMLHEIGHALGFKHPFTGDPTLPVDLDNHAYTVMSYTGNSPPVLGPFDVQAGQAKYSTGGPTNLTYYNWDAAASALTQIGTGGADTIVGVGQADIISGGSGADTLVGLAGNDWMDGSGDADRLLGGTGNDTLAGGAGADFLYGEDGDDELVGGAGGDIMSGGLGTNSVSYANAGGAVSFSLLSSFSNTGDALGDTYSQIQGVIGSNYADRLTGDSADNTMVGGAGADTIDGGFGSDTLDYSRDATGGGTAAVAIYLSSNLAIDGFGYTDTITNFENVIGSNASSATYNDVILGNTGSNFIDARGGGDIVVAGDGIDVIYGGLGTDAIYGGNGGDTLVGSGFYSAFNGEVDYLIGEAGNDYIYTGSAGNAYIDGGSGNDNITGGSATDYVLSGSGTDTVTLGGGVDLVILYASELLAGEVDTYLDFTDGYDYIYANASLAAATTFVNGAGYSYMAITVAGGTHLTVFSGLTAAQVQDQVFFNL
jgi:Ca2+-binding RTX toxin-like protein